MHLNLYEMDVQYIINELISLKIKLIEFFFVFFFAQIEKIFARRELKYNHLRRSSANQGEIKK